MRTKKISKLQEKLTAYHQAGYAVAFYLFGIKLKFITINPNFEKDERGRTQPEEKPYSPFLRFNNAPSVLEARIDFERLVIINLAGIIAETKYRNRRSKSLANINLATIGKSIKLRSIAAPSEDKQLDKVRILFQSLPMINATDTSLRDFEHEMYFQWLWFRTATILTAEAGIWRAIEAVAKTLLEKKELTGTQAEKIMHKHISTRLISSSLHLTGERMVELLRADELDKS